MVSDSLILSFCAHKIYTNILKIIIQANEIMFTGFIV